MALSPPPIYVEDDAELQGDDDGPSACVMVFNANDASGAGGIGADITAMSSVGVHVLPVVISAISELVSDYAEVPVLTHMPDLSWWREDAIDQYLDACAELLLPQTTLLVGNYQTLTRWLLPEWSAQRNPTARDIAIAAHEHGVAYTLVTGIALPDQFIDNALCSPTSVIRTEKFERLEAQFAGAGDTLSAALAALIATDTELGEATSEALSYLDR
ncbi:MAG: hydroxymethylpyrimidine/phosphomethylpyrimidine kinase, partial [Betaproteobacteria bacterium]|nr:hydroxymethylpyrimidine/phosphomethylpyrimidine kinase [Betaproteobacteria bacterium]